MNTLILRSPDVFDSNFADVFDKTSLKLAIPSSGLLSKTDPESLQQRIYALHQSIFTDQQKQWFQRFPANGRTPDFAHHENELDSILESMGTDWLLQDALLNHLLPLWLSRVDDPVLFLYYTEPLECALALQDKWRFPISFGLALWESYMLAAANNLGDHPCIPVSCTKLRQSPQATMDSILQQLEDADRTQTPSLRRKCTRWPALSGRLKEELPSYSGFLQDSQNDILKRLDNGQFKQLANSVLTPQSADILDHYGQLRAGFEMLKTKHNELPNSADLEDCDNTAENSHAAERQMLEPEDKAASTLRSVTVHIAGMAPVEFVVDTNSPILKMLEHSLQTTGQTPDELIYLDYENEGTSALYFMKSSLLGLESTPLSS